MQAKKSYIEEIFERGLISIEPNMTIKNGADLALAYTPGVGFVCTEIKKHPELFWKLTIVENSVYILSDGSKFSKDFQSVSPSFMLPELEAISYSYKAFSNLNAFPLVFNSKLVKDGAELAWMLEKISPVVNTVELYEVDCAIVDAALEKLKHFEKIIITPKFRSHLMSLFADTKDPRYLTNLVISVAIKVFSYLKLWGAVRPDSFDEIAKHIAKSYKDGEYLSEFELKADVLSLVRTTFDKSKQLPEDSCGFDLQMDYVCPNTKNDLFYHDFKLKNYNPDSVFIHEKFKGMVHVASAMIINDLKAFLSEANWERIKSVCRQIFDTPGLDMIYSVKRNYCAIVTNGTRILGLGDIGPRAGTPVMEGKICLFKQLGGINVMPVCLATKGVEETVKAVKMIADSWSAINLEDISVPDCFVIEDTLAAQLKIPVFHDDQHGTAIACLAGLINALKLTNRKAEDASVVVNGAGAAGKSITELLIYYGFKDIIVIDTKGAIYEGREDFSSSPFKKSLSQRTNKHRVKGTLAEVIKGHDIFVGVSVANVMSAEMVRSMNKDPIIFALSNPDPEIYPNIAKEGGARIVATGRSDFPNQINNSVVFPGVFRGIIDGKVRSVTIEMKKAAAVALAESCSGNELSYDNILPNSLDPRCARIISQSVQATFQSEVKEGHISN